MQKPSSIWQALWASQPAKIMQCPRCQHLARFQQASSDGTWVCQRCLRYRVSADVAVREPQREERQPVHV